MIKIKTFLLIACVCSNLVAQKTKITIGTTLKADDAVVSKLDEGVEIFAQGLSNKRVDSAIVIPPYPGLLVQAFPKSKQGFLIAPRVLVEMEPGSNKYALTQAGTYDLQVISKKPDGSWNIEWLENINISGKSPTPIPDPDNPPPKEEDPEFGDVAAIIGKVIPNDPQMIKNLIPVFSNIEGNSATKIYDEVTLKRQRVLRYRQNQKADWDDFVRILNDLIDSRKVKTAVQLKAFYAEILNALKFKDSIAMMNKRWSPPQGFVADDNAVGMIWKGKRLYKECLNNGTCRYVWRDVIK